MIAFSDVVVRYPHRTQPALDGVSFAVPRGSLTAVVGPNGSGKSTLGRALIGRVALAGGTIDVDGTSIDVGSRRALATRVAVVTQREEPALPLSVRDYVSLGRYPHLGLWRGRTPTDVAAVDAAIVATETESLASRAVTELSGGEWQRVRFARAVAQGGEAVVLDEPTTFLDVGHEMAMFELLSRLAGEGRAVLLVSHQLNLVARFAARIVLLHAGRVAAAGAPAEVMQGAVLERVYEWPLVVTRDPAVGAPALVPLRAPPRR
ncbi:MAG: ABC transporter ATP-binding protein [Gemmatimonadaceae bacterium]|nr:ABC transporter ATP-binding protein [Gemmatimonadaceae bacterium]